MEQKIIKMYENNIGSTSIAKQLNITTSKVCWILQKNNIKMRSCKQSHKPKGLIEDYFSNINHFSKAYWLGLLAADGCVQKSKQSSFRLKIDLKLDDGKEILSLMANDVGYHMQNIMRYRTKLHRTMLRLSFPSDQMCLDLAKYNIVPNKTHQLIWPSLLPIQYNWHFIRGYFDGDGCITTGPRFQICGTYNLMKKIQSIFMKDCNFRKTKLSIRHKDRKNKTFTLIYGGSNQVKKIYSKLYENCKQYKFQRKLDQFHELLF